jgi:hypothetical protein
MLRKLFNTRSPFWQLLIYSVFFFAAILTVTQKTSGADLFGINYILTVISAVVLIVLSVIYTVQVVRYNRRHPKTPIRFFGLLPPELKEEDEGMRMFTARATRRVYIFHATLLPIFAIIYLYFLLSPVYVITGLAFLVIGHFAIYLGTIWPVLGEEE